MMPPVALGRLFGWVRISKHEIIQDAFECVCGQASMGSFSRICQPTTIGPARLAAPDSHVRTDDGVCRGDIPAVIRGDGQPDRPHDERPHHPVRVHEGRVLCSVFCQHAAWALWWACHTSDDVDQPYSPPRYLSAP